MLRNNIAWPCKHPAPIVIEADARTHFLRDRPAAQYDLVFLDPPFATDLQQDLCRLLNEGSLLADTRASLRGTRPSKADASNCPGGGSY